MPEDADQEAAGHDRRKCAEPRGGERKDGGHARIIAEYPVDMRRLLSVLAVAVLLTGCGSGASRKTSSVSVPTPKTSTARSTATTTTSSTRSASTVNSSPTYRYPTAVKNALMARCRRNGSRSGCDCVVRYFEGNFSYARLKAASIPKLVAWAQTAESVCSGE